MRHPWFLDRRAGAALLAVALLLLMGAASAQAPQRASDLVAAARAGNPEAQFRLGGALALAKPPNSQEAARWFRLAAERGHAGAQTALGRLYEVGHGVAQDYGEAVRWYRLAADQRNAAAQTALGEMLVDGRGVGAADPAEAARLFRLAADQGYAVAQMNLGLLHAAGLGVARDASAAYFWLNLAAARLTPVQTPLRERLSAARDALARELPREELERIQHLAAAWTPGSANVPVGGPAPPGGSQAASAAGSAARLKLRSSGTGFVINPSGFVLTNNHVVAECAEVRARHGADALGALDTVARDAKNDLAVLKLATRFADHAVFRDRGVRLGEAVVVYGFPLHGLLTTEGNLTTGSVSGLAGLRNDSRDFQISAPVQPGNSGGPLLDAGANVIGIVSAGLDDAFAVKATGSVPQNVNFAIKASVARTFLDARSVAHQTAGMTQELKPADIAERARKFTLYIECWR